MNSKGLLISELYENVVIQGEGMVAGTPTLFVRLFACDYECSWCDSLYAVQSKYRKDAFWKQPQEIVDHINRVTIGVPVLITLSGGNPALQDCTELLSLCHDSGHTVGIETQGTKLPEWADYLDSITISPKPPSSGMSTDWGLLSEWLKMSSFEMCLKVVVFDEIDFSYARVVRDYAQSYRVPLFLQAGTSLPYTDTSDPENLRRFREAILDRTNWLNQKVIENQWYDVRVGMQQHALLLGAKRGV